MEHRERSDLPTPRPSPWPPAKDPERTRLIRAGWNDAAWGRPQRALSGPLARLYALGYAGGLVFRRRTWGTPAVDVGNDAGGDQPGAAGGAEAAAEPSVRPHARTEP